MTDEKALKKREQRELAVRLVREGMTVLDAHIRKDSLRPEEEQEGPWRVGSLLAYSREERDQLGAVQALMNGYLNLEAPPRPLCIATFGAPGSGKSYGVKALRKMAEEERRGAISLPWYEINITQMNSTVELSEALNSVVGSVPKASVPFILFDEFDAALGGAEMGWLSWFLAPMQDGTFRVGGALTELKRAVYVFAGGTAESLEDFGRANPERFRAAKGPDFVSRLRGHLDVKGPNEHTARDLRRAVLLRDGLERVEGARTGRAGPARGIDGSLQTQMLDVGRYRHGARSIHAILEMTAAESVRKGYLTDLCLADLPVDAVLASHRDNGPLDPQLIEGLIGLSGGGEQESMKNVWNQLARTLCECGATVAFGGSKKSGDLAEHLEKVQAELPATLRRRQVGDHADPEVSKKVSAPVRVAYFHPQHKGTLPGVGYELVTSPNIVVVGTPPQSDAFRVAVELFESRWRMSCRCVARVFVGGGKVVGYSGRMPGLLEEAVLAMALGQPVYLLGAWSDATAVLGRILGLAATWGDGESAFGGPKNVDIADLESELRDNPAPFRRAGWPDLPLTISDAVGFLQAFAIGGPRWPDNGLSIEENRALFATTSPDEACGLVRAGLVRRFREGRVKVGRQ